MTDTADQAAEALRELIREAHGATKDLRAAIREARQVIASGAAEAERRAFEAANAELGRWAAHMQGEMNRTAAELNASVEAARAHVAAQLTPIELEVDEESGQLRVRFAGNLFDASVPLPGSRDG